MKFDILFNELNSDLINSKDVSITSVKSKHKIEVHTPESIILLIPFTSATDVVKVYDTTQTERQGRIKIKLLFDENTTTYEIQEFTKNFTYDEKKLFDKYCWVDEIKLCDIKKEIKVSDINLNYLSNKDFSLVSYNSPSLVFENSNVKLLDGIENTNFGDIRVIFDFETEYDYDFNNSKYSNRSLTFKNVKFNEYNFNFTDCKNRYLAFDECNFNKLEELNINIHNQSHYDTYFKIIFKKLKNKISTLDCNKFNFTDDTSVPLINFFIDFNQCDIEGIKYDETDTQHNRITSTLTFNKCNIKDLDIIDPVNSMRNGLNFEIISNQTKIIPKQENYSKTKIVNSEVEGKVFECDLLNSFYDIVKSNNLTNGTVIFMNGNVYFMETAYHPYKNCVLLKDKTSRFDNNYIIDTFFMKDLNIINFDMKKYKGDDIRIFDYIGKFDLTERERTVGETKITVGDGYYTEIDTKLYNVIKRENDIIFDMSNISSDNDFQFKDKLYHFYSQTFDTSKFKKEIYQQTFYGDIPQTVSREYEVMVFHQYKIRFKKKVEEGAVNSLILWYFPKFVKTGVSTIIPF